jgi:hypothetical protein
MAAGDSSMTKTQVSCFLALYLIVITGAAFLRIDRFPLTWAPMYSTYVASSDPELRRHTVDKKHLKETGWKATHRDGTTRRVTQRDLNIRSSSMRIFYYRRMFEKGYPGYAHLNHDAGTIDRVLFGLEPGELYYVVNFHEQLLRSVNRTLGYEPADPKFIVRIDGDVTTMVFDRATLDLLREEDSVVSATWDENWTTDF